MTLSMRNKIMLALAIVSMIYGASTFTAGAIATTDAGGRAMTLVSQPLMRRAALCQTARASK